MTKKYDSDIIGWYRKFVGGKWVSIPRRQPKGRGGDERYRAPAYKDLKKALDRASSDRFVEGTYNAETLEPVSYDSGYQVTYFQIGDSYTENEHNELIRRFISHTDDGIVSLGKFEGAPELSFHFGSKRDAIRFAEEFNQISIWDWEQNKKALECERKYGENDPRTIEAWLKCEINTGGTGRRK